MLTVLKLHSCEGITSASMAAISHSYMLEVWIHFLQILLLPAFLCHLWPNDTFSIWSEMSLNFLQVLELDMCSLLTSVSLDLPRLQNIRLVHCRKYIICCSIYPPFTQSFFLKKNLSLPRSLISFPSVEMFHSNLCFNYISAADLLTWTYGVSCYHL